MITIGRSLVPPVIALFVLAAGALAQVSDVALDTLGQALDVEAAGELNAFSISGFAVAAFDYRSSTDVGSITAAKLAISVFKRAGPHFSFFGQLTTLIEEEPPGAAEEEPPDGEEGHALATEIDNAILSFTPPGAPELTFWLGRFDAEVGFERDDEPLNLQPTHSFNYTYARPVKFTGLQARYTPLPALSVAGLVTNGWDMTQDNNSGKTFGVRVSWLPHEYAAISLTGIMGPEQDDNVSDVRRLLSGDFTVQPFRSLILAGEFNYGNEEHAAPGGGDADWIGGVISGLLRLGANLGVSLRADVFDDRDGGRTGAPRTLQSYTIAPMLFFRTAATGIYSTVPHTSFALPEISFRAGLRWNVSNDGFFASDAGLSRHETQLVIEGVYVY
jgi:hypothetical protein